MSEEARAARTHHAFPEGLNPIRIANEAANALRDVQAAIGLLSVQGEGGAPSEQIAAIVQAMEARAGHEGGYFSVFLRYASDKVPKYLTPMMTWQLGSVPVAKVQKYAYLSHEKPTRLMLHEGHLLSWQSRDPDDRTTCPHGL